MPVEYAQWIRAGIAVDLDAEDQFVGVEITGLVRRDVDGVDQRRDAVLGNAAPYNLFEANVVGDAGPE